MNAYSNKLSRRLRHVDTAPRKPDRSLNGERLVSVAIRRNGNTHHGFLEHWRIRAVLNPENPEPTRHVPGDIEGFMTSTGRFVTRREAEPVAVAAGQLSGPLGRDLLSSDLKW